jgi:hypothetical protein
LYSRNVEEGNLVFTFTQYALAGGEQWRRRREAGCRNSSERVTHLVLNDSNRCGNKSLVHLIMIKNAWNVPNELCQLKWLYLSNNKPSGNDFKKLFYGIVGLVHAMLSKLSQLKWQHPHRSLTFSHPYDEAEASR